MMAYVPFEARGLVSNLLNVDPKKRADHDRLLNGSYFRDPQSKMNEFLELFFSKTEQQQKGLAMGLVADLELLFWRSKIGLCSQM